MWIEWIEKEVQTYVIWQNNTTQCTKIKIALDIWAKPWLKCINILKISNTCHFAIIQLESIVIVHMYVILFFNDFFKLIHGNIEIVAQWCHYYFMQWLSWNDSVSERSNERIQCAMRTSWRNRRREKTVGQHEEAYGLWPQCTYHLLFFFIFIFFHHLIIYSFKFLGRKCLLFCLSSV